MDNRENLSLNVRKYITFQKLMVCSLLTKGLFMELLLWSKYEGRLGVFEIDPAIHSSFYKCSEDELINALDELEKFEIITYRDGVVEIEEEILENIIYQ